LYAQDGYATARSHRPQPLGSLSTPLGTATCGSPKPNRADSTRVTDRADYAESMVAWMIRIVRLLIVLASRHRSLALENLALRQQLALYRRTRPKPTMRWPDRLFWIGLRAAWRDWKSALVVVRPPQSWRGIAAASRGTGPAARDRSAVARGPTPRSGAWNGDAVREADVQGAFEKARQGAQLLHTVGAHVAFVVCQWDREPRI
jgi:hypothetical protein